MLIGIKKIVRKERKIVMRLQTTKQIPEMITDGNHGERGGEE